MRQLILLFGFIFGLVGCVLVYVVVCGARCVMCANGVQDAWCMRGWCVSVWSVRVWCVVWCVTGVCGAWFVVCACAVCACVVCTCALCDVVCAVRSGPTRI